MSTPPPALENSQAPASQRDRNPLLAEWLQFLPQLRFRPIEPKIDDPLIPEEDIERILKSADPSVAQRIRDDIRFMDHELLRLFRQRDHEAKKQQNDYRVYQIGFLLLSAFAAMFGSLQALSLSAGGRELLAVFAFAETVIALTAVYLATISGREPPLPRWLDSRRKAEQLRREYFRFLMHLAPYDQFDADPVRRKLLLSERAANINRGDYPNEGVIL